MILCDKAKQILHTGKEPAGGPTLSLAITYR